jgi:isocitrate/isopropylmalate dehydrogenase
MLPSASLDERGKGLYEPIHGTAPDIAGKGLANPLACIMSGVMMLNHLADTTGDEACRQAAGKIRNAYDTVLAEGKNLTRDLGGTAGTNDFTEALIEKVHR